MSELPIEFMYADAVFNTPIMMTWQVAVYGLLSRHVPGEDLATRMAVFDGFSQLISICCTAASAPLFAAIGYYGVYGINTCCSVAALTYAVFVVREYPRRWTEGRLECFT